MGYKFNNPGGGGDARSAELTFSVVIPRNSYTFGCWYYAQEYLTSIQRIIGLTPTPNGDLPDVGAHINISQNTDNTIRVHIGADTAQKDDTTAAISLGEWHYLCLTIYSGVSNLTEYLFTIDGAKPSTTAAVTGAGDKPIDPYIVLTVGGRNAATNNFPCLGAISSASIWNTTLTLSQHRDLANGKHPFTVKRSNLITYYPLVNTADRIDRITGENIWEPGNQSSQPTDFAQPPLLEPEPAYSPVGFDNNPTDFGQEFFLESAIPFTGYYGKSTGVVLSDTTDVNGEATRSRVFPSDQPVEARIRKGTTSPYYEESKAIGVATATSGVDLSATMVEDE